MPDGMRDRIKAEAKANNRTMNAEIIARLLSTLGGTASGTAVIRLFAKGGDTPPPSAVQQTAELQLVTQQQLDELARKSGEAGAEEALRKVFQAQGIASTVKFGAPGLVQEPPPEPDNSTKKKGA